MQTEEVGKADLRCAVLTLLLVVLLVQIVPAQSYTVRNLGTLLTHVSSGAYDINDKGMVVGLSSSAGASTVRGFYIKPPYTVMLSIGVPTNYTKSYANSVNNHGVVVGYASSGGIDTPIVWDNGLMILLAPDGAFFATAQGISNNGRIAGRADQNGFLYGAGAFTTLTPLNNYDASGCEAVNSSGLVVGACLSTSLGKFRATRWDAGVPSELQVLSGNNSQANDVADNGTIVGMSVDFEDGKEHGFMITPGNMPVDLGILPGDTECEAFGTNGTDAVGASWSGVNGYRAVLFQGGEIKNLNDHIPPGSGWVLQQARSINIYGQICGYGTFEGNPRAFLLTPNPPTGGAADWNFKAEQNDWTAATSIPPFESAEAQWVPGIGYGIRATGFPSFAFLQSPEVTLLPGRTYRLWCTISTTATTAEAAPQIRLRAFQTTTNMSELLALDSVGDALPSLGSRTYEFTVTTQISGPAQTYRFYLDYTFFNPFDEQQAWAYLERVILAEI